MMRYLLLSVLVVCVIGVMIPSAFAQLQLCEQGGGVIVFDDRGNASCKLLGYDHEAYVQQQIDRQYLKQQQVEELFEFVKYAILIIVATVSAILIIVGFAKSRKKGTPAFCQNCRTVLKPTSKFCGKCGNQV